MAHDIIFSLVKTPVTVCYVGLLIELDVDVGKLESGPLN